jgi:hypothetical protein
VWQIWKELKEIAAVVAYEDLSTGSRASGFCQRLGTQLGHRSQITKNMWLVSELRSPQLRSIAAHEAARAHLVIVSLHDSGHLPEEVETWVEAWVRQKGSNPIVLVAIFDPVYRGASNQMLVFLKQTAKRGNMEFLVESEASPETH